MILTTHDDRIRSIRTPPKLSRVSPSKRPPRADDGPTPFQLMRQAEAIGQGIVCDVQSRKVRITGRPGSQAEAEFASSSALAKLRFDEWITLTQYLAGNEYAKIRRLIFGASVPKQSTLTKVMASSLEDRLHAAQQAARDERDDEEYAEYLADKRAAFEQGERALSHVQAYFPDNARSAAALASAFRNKVRIVVRRVCIDDEYPKQPKTTVPLLRTGLQALADTWRMD